MEEYVAATENGRPVEDSRRESHHKKMRWALGAPVLQSRTSNTSSRDGKSQKLVRFGRCEGA